MLKILFVHNRYQHRGGEDVSMEAEVRLLRERGEEVHTFFASNDEVTDMSRARLAAGTLWSSRSKSALRERLREVKPDVVHFRNTFPLISPAAYYAAREEGMPVVQMLSNYRLLCLNALFLREGRPCEDCLGKTPPWPGVLHACYRDSRAASGTVAAMISLHRTLGTWQKMVDVYLAPTQFIRSKYIEGGFPEEKIVVKPNFVDPDPGAGEGTGGYALFVGRLSHEKGVDTLLSAWERVGNRLPLKVVGDGPLSGRVVDVARNIEGVELLGSRSRSEVYELMDDAVAVVFPSRCYETFGLVAIEAFAKGTPVIASNIGAVAETVDDGRTGLLFSPGDPVDLASKVEWALAHPEDLERMRREARKEYEAKYTAERNYGILMETYEKAIERGRVRV